MESTKNSDIRVNNRRRLVNMLFRQGSMTKQELANRLDISLPTATLLIKELMEKGLIVKGETLDSTGGRKPVCLSPVYNVKYAVGMEVSMHELRIVLMDIGLNILEKKTYPYGMQLDLEYWKMVSSILNQFIDQYVEDKTKLLDVGLTLQLPMNEKGVIWPKTVPAEKRLDLKMVESCFQYPVVIRNSAKMAAIAQMWSGNRSADFVFVTIGTFVGGAIVHNQDILDFTALNGMFGSVIHGDHHMNDLLAIGELFKKTGTSDMDELICKIRMGDPVCAEVWENYFTVLKRLIFNLHQIFGWKVVIGGAICPYLEQYADRLYQELADMEIYEQPDYHYLEISDLGAHGAAMGAAMMPIDNFLKSGFNEI